MLAAMPLPGWAGPLLRRLSRLLRAGPQTEALITRLRLLRLLHQWRQVQSGMRHRPIRQRQTARLVILPSDPDQLTGALGDQAMIAAILKDWHAKDDVRGEPQRAAILCRGCVAQDNARAIGLDPIEMPPVDGFPATLLNLFRDGGFDNLAVIGADVMDGHYNAAHSACAVVALDLGHRSGMETRVLGFSFNSHPAPALRPFLSRLDPGMVLNLRDTPSRVRIRGFAPVQTRLVADAAFLLEPGDPPPDCMAWIAAERRSGRQVIGLNLHPALCPEAPALTVACLARAVDSARQHRRIAPLLISHDARAGGDDDSLDALAARLPNHFRLPASTGAAAIKGLAGQLDGMVTGRMHLAIAALGMGVPVLCLTYQDKFEGLLDHFDLPHWCMISGTDAHRPGASEAALARFLDELPVLRSQIARKLPEVTARARLNFSTAPSQYLHGRHAAVQAWSVQAARKQ